MSNSSLPHRGNNNCTSRSIEPSSATGSFLGAISRVWPAFSNAAFLHRNCIISARRRQICPTGPDDAETHLMVEATPPRRIVEGCSVKEMIFARGGSADRSVVERRKARPAGS